MTNYSKRRGAALAGIFSTAILSLALFCGAGTVPIENFSPQGTMQADLNAGGHNILNAASVNTTNLVVNGTSYAAPASVTGLRKSAGSATTDVAAVQSDLTGLLGGYYPIVTNNLSEFATNMTAEQNLGVGGSSVIAKSSVFVASVNGAIYNVTTGSNSLMCYLPSAGTSAGFHCTIRKADNSTGAVSVNGVLIGTVGHSVQIYCDGTSFYNVATGGALDGSGNFTYTLPLNASYNIVPGGTGQFQVGGLKVQPLDASGLLPLDAHTINQDGLNVFVIGSSIDYGYNLTTPYQQSWPCVFAQLPWGANHYRTFATTATTSAGSTTITVTSATGLAIGQTIWGNASLPNGDPITAISGTSVTLAAAPTVTNTTAVSVTFSAFYNLATNGSITGNASTTGFGGNPTNSEYSEYTTYVRPHRPVANGGDGVGPEYLFVSASSAYNDDYQGLFGAAGSITNLDGIATQARTDGFKVVMVATHENGPLLTGGAGANAGGDTSVYLNQVNKAVRGGGPNASSGNIHWDIPIDFSGLAVNSGDTSYYQSDLVHPTAALSNVMAYHAYAAMIAGGDLPTGQGASSLGNTTITGTLNQTSNKNIITVRTLTPAYAGGNELYSTVYNPSLAMSGNLYEEIGLDSANHDSISMGFENVGGSGATTNFAYWGVTGAGIAALVAFASSDFQVGNSYTDQGYQFYDSGTEKVAGLLTAGAGLLVFSGGLVDDTAGYGVQIKEGSNAKQGTATLVNGTVTVSNSSVTAGSRIFISGGALNSSTALGVLDVPTVTAGTSFVITSYAAGGVSTQTGDLRTVNYEIFEPAP